MAYRDTAIPLGEGRYANPAIATGRLFGLVHQGLWFDVGTPPAIAATEALLAQG